MLIDMEPWATHLIAFLVGAATGAAGHYLGEKYTDKRREKESKTDVERTFRKVRELMPELIEEMHQDLSNDANATIREFVILPNNRVMFNSSQPRLVYFENEHVNLKGKVSILENHGYVIDVSSGKTPIYRLNEGFVGCVTTIKT